jgi:hypothetical protein
MLKSFVDIQLLWFYSGSLQRKFIPRCQSSHNWHLHSTLPATQPPPIYECHSFTCPSLAIGLVPLPRNPESYLFVIPLDFLGLHSTPPFSLSRTSPAVNHLIFLSILGDGKADVSAEKRKCTTSFKYNTSKRTWSAATAVRRSEQLVAGFGRVVYFQQP